jgi:EmrB/QacA subfamily drug resistance transporter
MPLPLPSSEAPLVYGTSRARWVIAASVLGSGIASLDATVVGIALPAISRSFHTGLGTLQWVVTGYSLTLASLLLMGGSLGDRLGRKRVFTVGVVWFAVTSAACGLAPSAGLLIAARVAQGVGGALLTPASLAMLQASFQPDDRSRAIGAWSGLGGLATAAGPLLGGYLIAAGSWRWVFFINLPICIAVMFLTARHVPESKDPTVHGPIDVPGAALAVVMLTGLTYGLIEGSSAGWLSPLVVIGFVCSAIAAPVFLLVERTRQNPMLQLTMFRQHQFAAANAVTFVIYGALGGALFLLPVELQTVVHYSALHSGLALLPVTAIMLVFSARSARLSSRIGPRFQMSAGPLVVGTGLMLLTRATHHGNYFVEVFPAVVTFGAGLAITVAPLTATAMAAAPPEHAGVASAVNNVVARAAGLLAVALLPLAAGITGSAALGSDHLAAGFRVAVTIAGVTCALGGILAVLTIRNPRSGAPPAKPPERHWHCAVDGAPLQPGPGPAPTATPA